MLGNKPVVMVFARKAEKALATLVKELDKQVAKNADQKLSSFVNLIGKDPAEPENHGQGIRRQESGGERSLGRSPGTTKTARPNSTSAPTPK